MKNTHMLLALFLTACSSSSLSSYDHPDTLEEVIKDGRFKEVFKSDAGSVFYVRNLDQAELGKLSSDRAAQEFVLNGDMPMLYVAVTDGKVLQKPAPIGELAAFGMTRSTSLAEQSP